jgi:hypothetical protein
VKQTGAKPRSADTDLTVAIGELTALLRDLSRSLGELTSRKDERIAALVSRRVGRVLNGGTPIRVEHGPKLVIQMLAVDCFGANPHVVNVADSPPVPLFDSGGGEAFCNEGRLTASFVRDSEKQPGYALLMPIGIEAVHAFGPLDSTRGPIYVQWLERKIVVAAAEYLGYLQKLMVPGTLDFFCSLVSFEGLRLKAGEGFDGRHYVLPIASSRISLPRIRFVEPDRATNVASKLRPLLDALWRTGGWKRCFSYDASGTYKPG